MSDEGTNAWLYRAAYSYCYVPLTVLLSSLFRFKKRTEVRKVCEIMSLSTFMLFTLQCVNFFAEFPVFYLAKGVSSHILKVYGQLSVIDQTNLCLLNESLSFFEKIF